MLVRTLKCSLLWSVCVSLSLERHVGGLCGCLLCLYHRSVQCRSRHFFLQVSRFKGPFSNHFGLVVYDEHKNSVIDSDDVFLRKCT